MTLTLAKCIVGVGSVGICSGAALDATMVLASPSVNVRPDVKSA